MSECVSVPAGYTGNVAVLRGPRLLTGATAGPSLAAHRRIWPDRGGMSGRRLLALLERVGVPGRGGAGFPFARKVAAALQAGRHRELVVNAAEGEPGSAKDSALLLTVPHLVLDGAELVAGALGVRTIRVVVASERPAVRPAVEAALAERAARYELHQTTGGFVGGQARAVLEMLEGRENLPVTGWRPATTAGLRGRPTVLSNAETFAQVAVLRQLGADGYSREGTGPEPGTTLLTVAGDGPGGTVLEVPHGTGLADVLDRCGQGGAPALLVGGYHGSWLSPQEAARLSMSRQDLAIVGAAPGAGVLLPLDEAQCPVQYTSQVVGYLAGQSARRCGPCRFGLPALAVAVGGLAGNGGPAAAARVVELADLVRGRGACAHPDGTSRLVRSLARAFPAEWEAHRNGRCAVPAGVGSW